MTGGHQMLLAAASLLSSASASPSTVNGVGNTPTQSGNCTATTTSTTVTATGGSGSYTYAWAFVAGTGTGATANSPTARTTTFFRTSAAGTSAAPDKTYTGTLRCTVTDSVTGRTASADVVVSTMHSYVF
jgi:hypothetical protein